MRESNKVVAFASGGWVFFGVSALLFTASATLTIIWCASMSAMSEMLMPGGWSMSMAWMRMPGQTWPGAAASFLGMWIVMMLAMMLPALAPVLWRYREAVAGPGEAHPDWSAVLVGVGYFFVWTVVGMAAFPLGVALTAIAMRHAELARAVPFAIGAVVLIAGLLQWTPWKARHLACCRTMLADVQKLHADAVTAWRHGLRLGLHCIRCCAGLIAILLVIGVMDIRAMGIVAAAITIERLAPAGERVARISGAVIVVAGLLLIMRAFGFAVTDFEEESKMSELRYPNESREYRDARDALLKDEQELVEKVKAVAAKRRTLPRGGRLKEDYTFQWATQGKLGKSVKFSELFAGKNTLLIYSFMFGPNWDNPCPSCTSLMDGFDRTSYQVTRNAAFVAIAKAPAERIDAWARQREWSQIALVSGFESTYQADYKCQGDSDDMQLPVMHAFMKRDGAIFHFWGTERQENHVDTVWAYWNLMVFTPEGRPDLDTPPQTFRSEFLEKHYLNTR